MALEGITWKSVVDYRRGYEHRHGTAHIALDPDDPVNAFIVDIDRARRDGDGLVRFEADVVLLAAPEAGDLLHVVANRGLVTALPYGSAHRFTLEVNGEIDEGDGWALDRGISVLWVGWQWDVERRPGVVGVEAPEALGDDGRPIAGQARLGFQPMVDSPRRRLADVVLPQMGDFRALPAADLADPSARLTQRDYFRGPSTEIPRDRWRFADEEHLELDGGFRARVHYELTYRTSRCPVTGVGLAAVRDVVGAVRHDYDHSFGMGISQSGRWLRQFVADTGNADENGRRVFDGIHCHIAGGRKGEFNHRYAQPSTMNALGFTHLPPFSPSDGLLDRARAGGTSPRLVFTNTATEYWRGDASLSHPEPEGPEWRCYLYAGAHHTGQVPGYTEMLPVQLKANLVDIGWTVRAHFEALREWVAGTADPPPSQVPRPEDGSAVSREEVLARFVEMGFAGVELPGTETLLGMPPVDLGPDASRGIGVFPPRTGRPRDCYVSAVDDDGNEVAGVRLPEVAVPLGVSVGWNPEKPRPGVPVEIWNLVGGRVPFGRDEVLRRYGDRDGYMGQVGAVVDDLVTRRHLLAGDAGAVVGQAGKRWDREIGE